MIKNNIIFYYIFKKIALNILMLIFGIAVLNIFIIIMELLVFIKKFGISYSDVLQMALYIVPIVIHRVIQFMFFFGLVISFNYMFNNNEIVIMKSSGLNNFTILRPIILFALILILFCILNSFIYPTAYLKHKKLRNNFQAKGIFNTFQKQAINNIGNYSIYISNVTKEKFEDVTIISNANNNNDKNIIYSESIFLENYLNDDLMFNCQKFENYNLNNNNNTLFKAEQIQIPFNALFKNNSYNNKFYTHNGNTISNIQLFKRYFSDEIGIKTNKDIATTFHERILILIHILTISISLGYLLIERLSPRIKNKYIDIKIGLLFGYFILSWTFLNSFFVTHGLYYIPYFICMLILIFFIKKNYYN